MNKIGILSGKGHLPIAIGKNLINKEYDVKFFCIEKFYDPKDYRKFNYEVIKLNSLTNIINALKKSNINKIIMAGSVKRPSIKDLKFDLNTFKLIKNYSLQSKGDDKLLSSILLLFEKNGFKILDWKKECKELFSKDVLITKNKPSKKAYLNLKKGLDIFRSLGKVDISQSTIIQNEYILGIEAAEGTDELIRRCATYKKKGDQGILLKLSKYNQNSNLDIPVIGLNTVKLLKKYDYEGVFIDKNKCIILDKNEVIKFCNEKKLFISNVVKN